MSAPLGIIAGTGFYDLPQIESAKTSDVETAYGKARITRGSWHGHDVVFMTRHGAGHSVPPHLVNYRANIRALADLGVEEVIAVNVVGGIDPKLSSGSLVLVDDFIDFTSGRIGTFFDGVQDSGVRHDDMTDPYDKALQRELLAAAKSANVPLGTGAIYICFDGPRFETAAEIKMAASWGATVVGMTGCPEVALAREAGLRYASIGLVSNPGTGVSDEPVSVEEIHVAIASASARLLSILDTLIEQR
jgi:5'-deoxy-5'-methylthioadenosine phosphorylase